MTDFQRLLFVAKTHSNVQKSSQKAQAALQERFSNDKMRENLYGAALEHHGQGMFVVLPARL
jgi:hypothetical protein